MFDLLENLESKLHPTEEHWIFPGTVRYGTVINVSGVETSLLLAELAVAAATYTKFVGCLEPDLVPNVLFVPRDSYKSVVTIRRLLIGRGIKDSPKTLKIATGDAVANWPAVEDEAKKISALLIIDQTTEGVEPRLKYLTNKSITSVIRNNPSAADFEIKAAYDLQNVLFIKIGKTTIKTMIKKTADCIIFKEAKHKEDKNV
jgi:hypothetical protein